MKSPAPDKAVRQAETGGQARQTPTGGQARPRASLAMFVCVVIAVGLAVAFFASREAWTPLLYFTVYRLTTLLMGGLIVASAIAIGLILLDAAGLSPSAVGERVAYAGGLGLGVLSLGLLILGLLGFMPGVLLWILLLVLLLAGSGRLLRIIGNVWADLRSGATTTSIVGLLWLIIVIFFAMNLTSVFVPPQDYDELEYHLAAPASYNEAGRIEFMPNNVYASFPQNFEMLFLLGMRLDTQRDGGTEVGKVVNVAIGLLTALAISGLGTRMFSRGSGAAAAAIFYVWPGVTYYSGVAYVELMQMLYTVLALAAVSQLFDRQRRDMHWRRTCLLAGVFGGLAMGTKYTAALMFLVPLTVVLLGLFLIRREVRRGLLAAILFGAGVLVVMAPWMIKNAAATGNPLYPLGYSVLGGSQWSAEQDARWKPAHGVPQGKHESGLVPRVWEFLAGSPWADFLLFLFVPVAFLRPSRERAVAIVLLILFGFGAVLWYGFTHRADRFLDPLVPFLALLSGAGAAWMATCWPRYVWPVVVVLLLFSPARYVNYRQFSTSLPLALEVTRPSEFLLDTKQSEFAYVYPVMQHINDPAQVPDNARILFLGEARTYYCDRDAVAATVFNRQPIEEAFGDAHTPLDVFRNLTEKMGITHILINTAELARLQDTYRFDFEGRRRLGMLDGFDWGLFEAFARQYLDLMEWSPRDRRPNVDWSQWGRQPMPQFVGLYRIKP